ncbi:MAG: DegT/DnrJ/EryC1/StrS family aminotransferase [Treponemataceae bacterium]|nr:MAG: DegT/DnrJ/EryC1/StrS family aminotransferase [Treponemataceae bacterium]
MIQTFSSTIRRKEMDAVLTCMVDEKIGPGDFAAKLIAQAKEFLGVDGAAAFRSPALALWYALSALDVPKGSGVAVSALAPAWHYAALIADGYTPVLLDIMPETAQVLPDTIEEAVKGGARAILHYEPLGYLCDMEPILAPGVPVIEDISQSAGSAFGQEDAMTKAGQFGVFAILGLEERDAVTAGGGAILAAHKRRDALALKKRLEGALAIDLLPDINAALAYIQLKEFAKNQERRKIILETYTDALMRGSRHKMISTADGCDRAAFCFAVALESGFKDVQQYAAKKGIAVEQAFAGSVVDVYPEASESCVNARSLFLRTAVFPFYPLLTNVQAKTVCKTLSTLP